MTNFARSLSAAGARSYAGVAVLLLLSALACSALFAAPAGAKVTTVGGTTVGLQPRNAGTIGEGSSASFANEAGNAVLHGTSVYGIFWDPEDIYHERHEWMGAVEHFMQQMGVSSGGLETIFASVAQYRDRSNTGAADSIAFKGAYHDFTKYPGAGCTDPHALVEGAITCLTDAQLRAQLQSFIAGHGLPTGMHTIYYLITPPGVTVCLDAAGGHCSDFAASTLEEEAGERNSTSWDNSFCSYHGAINADKAPEGDNSTILYGAIPWTAGAEGKFGTFTGGSHYYDNAFDCQDGGWMYKEGAIVRETPKTASKEEQEILNGEKGTALEKAELEERRRLEGPHIQEPNQEGRDEFGDYRAGLSDLMINQIAVEQDDIVTDPLLESWKDPSGYEVTDLCRDFYGNTINGPIEGDGTADPKSEAGFQSNETVGDGRYYINNVYSLSGRHCAGGVGFVPRFTAPNTANAGEVVGLDGMGSTVGLLETLAYGASGPPTPTYATYTWNFGDGTEAKGYAPGSPVCEAPWLSPCAGSVFHTYAYGGTYNIVLRITDVAGNTDVVEHELTVNGPPAPGTPGAAAPGGATPGSAAPAAPAGSGSGSGKGAGAQPGKPVATASVISQSLKSAVKKGLAVAYSVNEQVTGRFEVLISKALAKKLKISGTAATGLPAGTPPELVIGKAILVTAKGGHSVVHVMLTKSASGRLRHARKAQLMLRLIVRNAASTPETTTVISAATLVG